MQWPSPLAKMLNKPPDYDSAVERFSLLFGLLLDVKSPYAAWEL